MMESKPVDTTMDPNVKLFSNQRESSANLGRYCKLVGKLYYLMITWLDISFVVSVVSQFLDFPCKIHWDAVMQILGYIKGRLGKGLSYEDKGHTQIVGYFDVN